MMYATPLLRVIGGVWTRMDINLRSGGVRGVMVIVVENGHGDTSSNPGRGRLHFT